MLRRQEIAVDKVYLTYHGQRTVYAWVFILRRLSLSSTTPCCSVPAVLDVDVVAAVAVAVAVPHS